MPPTPLPAQPPSPPRSGNAEANTSSARCASEQQSPSKRLREAGETSRALALVSEEEGDAPRAAIASPKRRRTPWVQIGVGLPCCECGQTLTAACAALGRGLCGGRLCAPSAAALAVAGWNHDRPP